uniref:Vasculin n=1 Tax=Otus sunia TaxID=257818 RepID=A0A8C8A553_9STRI
HYVDQTLNICILENCCIVCHSFLLKIDCIYHTACAPLQSSLNFEKHSENFSWTENHYEANHRRDISSDGFDPNIGWPNAGHFGRKEKNSWHSQSRNGTENINHHGGYHGRGSCTRTSTFHCGKGQGLHENNVSDNETGKKEDKEVPKQFEAEDFPSLNPEYERTPNQTKSSAAGVWDITPNIQSKAPLVQLEVVFSRSYHLVLGKRDLHPPHSNLLSGSCRGPGGLPSASSSPD